MLRQSHLVLYTGRRDSRKCVAVRFKPLDNTGYEEHVTKVVWLGAVDNSITSYFYSIALNLTLG